MNLLRLAALLTATVLLAACASNSGNDDYAERMAREHAEETPEASGAAAMAPRVEVAGEEVLYGTVDGKPLRGYLAHPVAGADTLPGILVIHEWWGLNDNIRAMARRLAGEGYAALAVDLYGGESAGDPQAARRLMQAAMQDRQAGIRNLAAAADFLRGRGAERLGTIGWCFGGGWSLQAALQLPEQVDAAVMFYGQPVTDPQELARLDAPLLGLFGGADRGIPVDTVRRMEAELEQLGKPATIHVYPDANHAFANPSGQSYDAAAAEDAWRRTTAFFAAHLKEGES
jgi:carboxymethylenebutenolidase